MTAQVHVVLPDSVDDPARPSGGNAYDRRVCAELARSGWAVIEHRIGGGWPEPDAVTRAELAAALAAIPDGAVVLVDGLLAVPDVLRPVAGRLRLVLLVHLARGDEPLDQVRAVIATSEWTARDLARAATVAVHVAAPGVDRATAVVAASAGGALLCVGAVAPHKGQDVLVAALARLAELPWRCRIVGPLDRDRPFVADLRERIDRAGLQRRVELAGARAGADLDAEYRATDVLVVPSRLESYGMVVAEALARGRPVIAAASGGVPEAMGRTADGRRPGLLVPSGDAGALAAALRGWLTEPELRADLRAAAAERAGTLPGWPDTATRVAAVLRQVAA